MLIIIIIGFKAVIIVITILNVMVIAISFGAVMPHTVVLPEERARLQAEVHPLI